MPPINPGYKRANKQRNRARKQNEAGRKLKDLQATTDDPITVATFVFRSNQYLRNVALGIHLAPGAKAQLMTHAERQCYDILVAHKRKGGSAAASPREVIKNA